MRRWLAALALVASALMVPTGGYAQTTGSCADGSISHSIGKQGACSGHGGVGAAGGVVGNPAATPASSCANGTYINTAGQDVCRPFAATTPPAGATAQCGDGSYSFSQNRQGTCSAHGGVFEFFGASMSTNSPTNATALPATGPTVVPASAPALTGCSASSTCIVSITVPPASTPDMVVGFLQRTG